MAPQSCLDPGLSHELLGRTEAKGSVWALLVAPVSGGAAFASHSETPRVDREIVRVPFEVLPMLSLQKWGHSAGGVTTRVALSWQCDDCPVSPPSRM